MKKVISTILILMTLQHTIGQTEKVQEKIYKNEFGIDATGFIKYFLTFNQTNPSTSYSPTYYLTYRRKFKSGNIRSALGGNYDHRNYPSQNWNDLNEYYYYSYSIDLRIGWEFINNIGKRSQVYYGIDVKPSYSYTKNDNLYSMNGYAYGYETKNQYYGIAPLFGYRFRLSERISLTAETSLSLIWSKSNNRNFTTPTSSIYQPMSDEVSSPIKSLHTSFAQPLAVIVTFDL